MLFTQRIFLAFILGTIALRAKADDANKSKLRTEQSEKALALSRTYKEVTKVHTTFGWMVVDPERETYAALSFPLRSVFQNNRTVRKCAFGGFQIERMREDKNCTFLLNMFVVVTKHFALAGTFNPFLWLLKLIFPYERSPKPRRFPG